MLPYVKIDFKNGSLGGVEPMDDGVTLAFVAASLQQDIDCRTYEEFVDQFGADNDLIKAFFSEAGKCHLIVTGKTITGNNAETNIKAMLSRMDGVVRNVIVSNCENLNYLKMLQSVGEWAAEELFAPVMFFVSLADTYYKTNPDLKAAGINRVAVVDNVNNAFAGTALSGVPLLWYVAGRAASVPVQRSLARVKDGSLAAAEWYYIEGSGTSAKVRLVTNTYAEGKHEKGFITVRTFQGKAGYYISDDLMATAASDDYALVPRRRTIDKAYRVAYKTLVEYIGDEIPVTADGTIPTAICKEIENNVERNIYSLMTVEGNLGVDTSNPNDKGVTCYVDPKQNVVATSRIDITLKVKPYGYTKYIEVKLGFDTNA